jgi:hypothetical protein
MDDIEISRIARDNERLGFRAPKASSRPAIFGRVTTTSPTINHFINIIPQAITGTEVEGGTATSTDLGTDPITALLIGPGVPSTGDQVLATLVDYRWVVGKRVSGGGATWISTTCSPVRIPSTLTMTSVAPNNTTLWQGTLTYGPSPSGIAGLPPNCWIGPVNSNGAGQTDQIFFSIQTSGPCLGIINILAVTPTPGTTAFAADIYNPAASGNSFGDGVNPSTFFLKYGSYFGGIPGYDNTITVQG